MTRRPLRIATTSQLERSARAAGFDVYTVPESINLDFNRPLAQRLADGAVMRAFLEKHDVELLVDFNTEAMTFSPTPADPARFALTNALLGIPYVACYLDPVTSTMAQVDWADHWQILESPDWIKWVWESAHAEELGRLGVPNIITMPMAFADDDVDVTPLPDPDDGPAVAFMGHPASSWFASRQTLSADTLVAGLTAAAVNADMPHLPFHKIYYDLHEFAAPPTASDDRTARATKAQDYFNRKFTYNAYLAIKQRDRFARFLKRKLGDAFELIGDHWQQHCGLPHTPRIWDMNLLHQRMRRVPICLNLMKGCLETGLNIRHFEITGHGGFMLTYATPDLGQCFEVGKECEVFHHEEELLEKISYYLAHPDRRREIAVTGQRRTLNSHRYSHRFQTLVTLLEKAGKLPRRAAPSNSTTAPEPAPCAAGAP